MIRVNTTSPSSKVSSSPVTVISVPVVRAVAFVITTDAGTDASVGSLTNSGIVTSEPSPVPASSLKFTVAVVPSSPVVASVTVTTIPGASLSWFCKVTTCDATAS